MYNEGFGNRFHPKAATISCRDLIRYYPYVTEKNWNHGRQGKWMERKGNHLKIKRCEGVMGQALRSREKCLSPVSQRKTRRVAQVAVEETENTGIPVESIPKYPSWKSQNYNILSRTDCPRHLEESLQQEVAMLWEEWSLTAAKDYFTQKENCWQAVYEVFSCLFSPPYSATPPWKGLLERNTTIVSQRLTISTQIAHDFHRNHRSFALFDCQTFFGKEQTVEDFKRELKEFMKHASQRIRVKWPLSVGRIMLKEGDIWIPKLVDGSCREIFTAVAATMSRLLYDVLEENYQQLRRVFSDSDQCLLKVEVEDENQPFDFWESIEVFKEIAVVPCVEHLLYPRHFPPRDIDIRAWFQTEKRPLGPPLAREFTVLRERLTTLKTELGKLQLSMETLPQWDKLYKELEIISVATTTAKAVITSPPLCYDRSSVKKILVKEITRMEEKMKKELLEWQAKRNQKSHALFAEWCRLLCDANVLEQLRRVGELNTQLSIMEKRVSAAHLVYSTAWNHFNFPDADLRDYWEVSRLPERLATLAGYVWQRVEQDREWITRKVVDRTSNNYFEAETIEREFEQTLKKYKNQAKGPEIQRVAAKLLQLAIRCRDLVGNEKELQGERELLGLPGFEMDIHAMFKVTEYFSELTDLQYRTMSHEQYILESHVMDLNHEETVKATEALHVTYTKLLQGMETLGENHSAIPHPVLEKTKERLDKVTRLIPVINAVHNQGMKERHWQEVLKEVEMGAELRGNPIVGDLLQMNITEKAEKLEEISAVAEKEMQLEESVRDMKAQWDLATFDIRSKGLISTELSSQMASHIAKSQQILTSPYAFTILEQLRTWLDTLLQLHSFVELHSQCERLWHRVEGVFSTEDVAYQMPTEFRIFKKISLLWQQINSKITDEKPILEQLGVIIELNSLLKELQEDFLVLEKGFHAYLRKKRLIFPRLHLLSDERLLHLLSISRDPPAVNRVIRHLFPHFKMAVFNKRGEVDTVELLDGKMLKLSKAINVPVAKRHVEKWLAELDRETKTTVRLHIKSLLEKHSFTLVPLGDILDEETHVAVVFYRIVLTHMVEEALRHTRLTELEDVLKASLITARSFLDGPGRRKVEPLMVLIHQHIEIIQELLTKRVIFADDIVWRGKFRLYWNLGHVFIRVFDIATRYDYDIVTPLSNIDSHRLLGITLTWNRFATPLCIRNIMPSSRTISAALGRPLLEVAAEEQPFEGGLWLGPVAIQKRQTSNWMAAVADVQNNVAAGTNKVLVSSGDIPVNPSLLPLFSFFGKMIGEFDGTAVHLGAMFSIYGLADPQRWATRVYHFTSTIPLLFNLPPIPLSIVDSIWKEAVQFKRIEELAEQQAVGRALLRGTSPQITDELWSEFVGLLPEVNQSSSADRKCQELLQMLGSQRTVIVCGGSLSGKTFLIETAAQMAGVTLHINEEVVGEDGWWVVDGDRDKVPWVLATAQTTVLSFDPFIIPDNPTFRLIFECDTVPAELAGQAPILLVNDSTITWPPSFSLSEVVTLSAVSKELSEFSSRLLRNRVSTLAVLIEKGEASFLQVATFVIDCLDLTDEGRQRCMKAVQENHPGYFLPPTLSWDKCIESLFALGYVVFLPSSHGQSPLLEKVVAYLQSRELAVVEINLNTIERREEIEEFLERCELLFGGERNVVVCLKDFHLSSHKLQEFMRHSRRAKSHRFLVTSHVHFASFPERLRRYLFPITDQIKETRGAYPLKVYEGVVEANSRNTKTRDVRDAIRYELSRSLVELIKIDKKYSEVKRALEEDIKQVYRLARGKELCDIDELVQFYQQHQNEKRKGRVLEDEPIITEHGARRLCFLEKCLSMTGSVVVYDEGKISESQYWVDLAAGILGLELTQTTFGIFKPEDLHKALRRCLLEDQLILLVVNIDADAPLQLLHSLLVSRCVPPVFLSQQLITEFCEKHTVEGRGMWKRMSVALGKFLRVCLFAEKDKFVEFYKNNTELCEVSLIEWAPPHNAEDISAAVVSIVKQANVLDDSQAQEFHRSMERIVLPKDEDKIRMTKTFVHIAKRRKDAVNKIMNRYERGMEKLHLAEEQTGSLQVELSRLRPELVRTSIETSMLMSSIERETIEVENAREVVAANEHKSNQAAIAAQALRAESEADLANAIPALEASIEALETLNQSDVSTLKTMRFPPYGVRICMEAVCILLGEPPSRVPSPDGGFVNDYWPTGLKMLSDIHFLSRIRNFPRDSVSRKTMKLIKDRYLSKPEFDPEHIKQCSLAAEGLCLWVKAIEFYHRLSRIVEPKKEKLRQAELLVKIHLKQLEVKRKALQKVTEKLQHLSDQFGQMSQRKQDLQTQIATCEARIDRAERLVAALEGEKEKWLAKMDSIRADLRTLPHYCLIATLALEKYPHETQTQQRESLLVEEVTLFNSNSIAVTKEHLFNLCNYPFLLYNDYGRGWKIISMLFPHIIQLDMCTSSILRQHALNGTAIFLPDHGKLREMINKMEFGEREGKQILVLDGEETEITDGFLIFASSPNSEKGNWKFASVNMEYSKEELKEQIFICLGRENWQAVQNASDMARGAVREDVTQLDEMETNMLELLGRKEEDLDDEGAVELLAVTHETQERLRERQRELDTAEGRLEKEKERYLPLVEWAANVILFVKRFEENSPFYNMDVERLIQLMDTRVNEQDLGMTSPPHVWKSFWHFCSPFLDPDHRKLLFCGLKTLHTGKKATQGDLESLIEHYEEPEQSKMLSEIVWAVDNKSAVLIALVDPKCEVAVMVRDIAKGAPVQWTSFPEYAIQNLEQLADNPSWLAVTLSDLSGVDSLLAALRGLKSVHVSFRLILVLSSLEGIAPDCLSCPTRFCLSSPLSLSGLLFHTANSVTFKIFFHSATHSKRSNAIRLVAFHFAVRSRIRDVDDVELKMALTLFKETHCDEETEMEDLFDRVIGTVYLPRARNRVEKTLVKTLFRWIYQGLNRMDDSTIKGCIGGELEVEAALLKLKKIDDGLFGGRALKLVQYMNRQTLRKLVEEMDFLMGSQKKPEQVAIRAIQETPAEEERRHGGGMSWRDLIKEELVRSNEDIKRRDYLSSLLQKDAVAELDATFISNPNRVLAILTAQFAVTQRIPLEEVMVTGTMDTTGRPTANRIILRNCVIWGARWDQKELKEQEKTENQRLDIVLTAGKKQLPSAKQEKTLPLLDGHGEFLCDVAVHTNISLSHWHLRGAYFSTG